MTRSASGAQGEGARTAGRSTCCSRRTCLGRRGRAAARTHGRRRSAEDHRRVHPGHEPRRARHPASSARCSTGRGRATSPTTSGSSTTTRPSTSTSRRSRSRRSRRGRSTRGLTGVLVSLLRLEAGAAHTERGAGELDRGAGYGNEVVEEIVSRAWTVSWRGGRRETTCENDTRRHASTSGPPKSECRGRVSATKESGTVDGAAASEAERRGLASRSPCSTRCGMSSRVSTSSRSDDE